MVNDKELSCNSVGGAQEIKITKTKLPRIQQEDLVEISKSWSKVAEMIIPGSEEESIGSVKDVNNNSQQRLGSALACNVDVVGIEDYDGFTLDPNL
ncbi:hypothetical protein QTN25_007067 [Entamoeba marina]